MAQDITEDEARLYDRQIRLWGLDAQKRMGNARLLLVTLRALGNEVVKNLVLAGVGSVTILESEVATTQDLGGQFFLRQEDVGRNRAQAAAERIQNLNPRVKVIIDTSAPLEKDEAFYKDFNLICAMDCHFDTLLRINQISHAANIPFYASGINGWFGYVFTDLLKHEYYIERKQTNAAGETTTIKDTKVDESYVSLQQSMQFKFDNLTKRQLRRVSPVIIAMRLFFQFQSNLKKGSAGYDAESFVVFKNEYLPEIGLPSSFVTDDMAASLYTETATPTELSPVAAIVGGVLAQDILNVLAGKEPPISNWFGFDGHTGAGLINKLT